MRAVVGTIRRLRATVWIALTAPRTTEAAVALVRRSPTVTAWLRALGALQPGLDAQSQALLENHGVLRHTSATWHYREEINAAIAASLTSLRPTADDIHRIAAQVIGLIVEKKTAFQCRDAHTVGGYYAATEPHMEQQWRDLIEPHLRHFDLTTTLELAPGHGRNSAKLAPLAKELHLVDVNRTCIDACRARFGDRWQGCRFHYHVNDGTSLAMIPDGSISFIYSFDSMVHFDKTVVSAYFKEFHRVLASGGGGFVHHSNYGEFAPNSDWATNPGGRSDTSAELVSNYCRMLGLDVIAQHLHGQAEGRHMDRLDCATLFRKP